MEIIPAIDFRNGKCVRLYQGDYSAETVYEIAPETLLESWISSGAKWIHIVDLDGAIGQQSNNLEIIESLKKRYQINMQFGGGIRSLDRAKRIMNIGIDRIVLGTIAVASPKIVEEICIQYSPENIIVAIDAKDDKVTVKGWTEKSNHTPLELIKLMQVFDVQRFLYTDVERDGTLTSPNFKSIKELVLSSNSAIQASGGIAKAEQLIQLKEIGAESAILGKALLDKVLELGALIKLISQKPN